MASEHAKSKYGAMDKNAMWIEKYRPKSLDDVAAHKEIIDTSEPWFLYKCQRLSVHGSRIRERNISFFIQQVKLLEANT